MENFLHTIEPWRVISSKEDKLILKGSNFGNYSVKLMCEVLNRPASSPMPFLALSIWNLLVPLKVVFFCLGGVVGKGVDAGLAQMKGKTFSK